MGRSYKENDEEFIKFKKMLDNMLEGVCSSHPSPPPSQTTKDFFLSR